MPEKRNSNLVSPEPSGKTPKPNFYHCLFSLGCIWLIWETQNGTDCKLSGQGIDPRLAVSVAHHLWLEKNPDRAEMFYAAIDDLVRFSPDISVFSPEISAVLSTFYREINLMLWEMIWTLSDKT